VGAGDRAGGGHPADDTTFGMKHFFSGKIIDTKIIFGITAERRETILNHNRARGQVRERATEGWPEGRGNGNDRVKWLGWARIKEKAEKRRAVLGQAKLLWIFKSLRKRACIGL